MLYKERVSCPCRKMLGPVSLDETKYDMLRLFVYLSVFAFFWHKKSYRGDDEFMGETLIQIVLKYIKPLHH